MSKQVLSSEQMLHLQELGYEYLPAYTLQDILDVLPKTIDGYKLEMGVRYDQDWFVAYINGFQTLHYECSKTLIDAAHRLLCWAIEKGYVETNKTKEEKYVDSKRF